jgi:arylsulfatase A-like enzyme
MIKSLDDEIGELMATLRKYDLDKNTLIFFISDNGGATYTHTTDNAPLRGGKITDFEGGLNVPMIFKWQDHLPAGIHYTYPVISMDIFGTIASVLDIQLPEDRKYDGINLMDFVDNDHHNHPPHRYLYWNRGNTKAVRTSDFKMVLNTEFRDTLLFDMRRDNLERTNVLSNNPNEAADLLFHYDQWEESLQPPLWPPLIYYVHQENGKKYYFDN